MNTDTILEVHLYNSKPIEVVDLADMMTALADEYSSFCGKKGYESGSKLFVSEVRKGSVILDLIASAGPISMLDNVNTIVEFGTHIKNAYNFLRGNTSEKPESVDVETYKNFKKIVEPSCKDPDSRFSVSVVNSPNASINVMVDGVSHDAGVVKQRANAKDGMENLPSVVREEKIVVILSQLRNSGDSVVDRGIIEKFSKTPKKLISVDENFKKDVLDSNENAFRYGYVVDVEVTKIGDRVLAYRILKYHEKFLFD